MKIENNSFVIDGKKINIYSGAIHYFRSMPDRWEDLLLKLKAAGLNTVETYVAWNLHERKEGEFDFSGRCDVKRFLETARKLGLYVIFRSGPFICAEWDMGGLPPWLLKDRNMKIRCSYKPYLDYVERYMRRLFDEIRPELSTNGGNIIAVQIENEYGHYGSDKEYMAWLRDLYIELGCKDELLFTSDDKSLVAIKAGMLDGVYETLNFGSGAATAFDSLKGIQDDAPKMCMEFWCGWFDYWGGKHHTRDAKKVMEEIRSFLDMGASFNFYMFHGGTNFGFYSGANSVVKYHPVTTSYDYNAVLTETGDYTPLYHALRKEMISRGLAEEMPLPPAPTYVSLGEVQLTQYASLFDQLDNAAEKIESKYVESMEHFGQNNGYIHYRARVTADRGKTMIMIGDLHEYADVYVNGVFKKHLYSRKKNLFYRLSGYHGVYLKEVKEGDIIDIFVDAMGHVNFGAHITDRKGISDLRILSVPQSRSFMNIEIYCLDMEDLSKITYDNVPKKCPAFLKGSFKADKKGECYLDMRGFTKGFVKINGFNIGRYWNKGPQLALYIPSSLLKDENEIIIFEEKAYKQAKVTITDHPIWK